ncbi:hypothetical protein D3C73_1222310 [compost metagenome]
MTDDLPAAGPVNLGRLVILLVNPGNRRREDQRTEANQLPAGNEGHRPDRPPLICEEADRFLQSEYGLQEHIKDAVRRMQNPAPDRGDGYRSHNHRQEDQRTVQITRASSDTVGKYCDKYRYNQGKRDDANGID